MKQRFREIRFTDGTANINFGDEYEFPSNTPTRFQSSTGAPYALGALLFFMQHRELPSIQYFQKATEARVDKVSRPDAQVSAQADHACMRFHALLAPHMCDEVCAWHCPDDSCVTCKPWSRCLRVTLLSQVLQNVQQFLLGNRVEADIPNITSEAAASASSFKRPRHGSSALDASTSGSKASQHERRLRCRDNLLLVANKDFSKVLDVYKNAEKSYIKRATQDKQHTAQGGRSAVRAITDSCTSSRSADIVASTTARTSPQVVCLPIAIAPAAKQHVSGSA